MAERMSGVQRTGPRCVRRWTSPGSPGALLGSDQPSTCSTPIRTTPARALKGPRAAGTGQRARRVDRAALLPQLRPELEERASRSPSVPATVEAVLRADRHAHLDHLRVQLDPARSRDTSGSSWSS
ncbi:hypothetical protein HBB16_07460 [Pseudonocardia sp. MCCB 268]|nr:hypothetical protein [Pseudonocardia cytotoxica]